MSQNQLLNNDELKYRVVDANGKTLRDSVSRVNAEMFVEGLGAEAQGVRIVPIVGGTGKQVLFG